MMRALRCSFLFHNMAVTKDGASKLYTCSLTEGMPQIDRTAGTLQQCNMTLQKYTVLSKGSSGRQVCRKLSSSTSICKLHCLHFTPQGFKQTSRSLHVKVQVNTLLLKLSKATSGSCTLTLAAAMPSSVRAPRGPPVLQAALVPPNSCTFCCMFIAPVTMLLPKKSLSSASTI